MIDLFTFVLYLCFIKRFRTGRVNRDINYGHHNMKAKVNFYATILMLGFLSLFFLLTTIAVINSNI